MDNKDVVCCTGNTAMRTKVSSGILTIDDTKLHYIIEGKGIPCLVIDTRATMYQPTFSEKLKEHLKFIFVDNKSFLPISTTVEVKINIETIIDDFEKARVYLGFDKIAVLGHSVYGLIALEYARKYYKHTSHVIMIGTFPNLNTKIRKEMDKFWELDASEERKQIEEKNNEYLTEEILSKVSPSKAFILQYIADAPYYWYDPTYDCSWIWEGVEFNASSINQLLNKVLEDYDFTQNFTNLKMPIFLALGRYDYVSPYYLWDNLTDKFPNLSYNLFEESGHWSMLEEQQLFDKKLIEWITNS